MYISLNWLKDFVKIPAKIDAAEISRELTNHTVEVEGFVNQAEQFDKVVVGRVLEVKKHPNADRLRLALVDVKTKKLNIVCGAPNLAEGQLVPVALVGAILPGNFEIKESEIRGEKSCGMICAEDELGIGKNHEGIIVLPENSKVGEAFTKYLKADDIILEVDNKSLSNRPDLLSHYGIARELGVIFDLALKPYEKIIDKKIKFLSDKENKLEVKVADHEASPRYMAIKIDGIEIKESPVWLKNKLIAVNQKPINNIVDLTNFIMLECGQPLHAFSADKVEKILVRYANKNETVETLDEKERHLNEDDLVISDGKNALAIAGIMGGKDSGIKNETTSIILESANFKAAMIRKSSQKLGLRTEASSRYEKSLDPELTEVALFRFLTLLKEICPDYKIGSSLIDLNQTKKEVKEINLDLNWLTKKIGQEIPHDRVIKTLKQLGFGVHDEKAEIILVSIPSWRATKDVSAKEDLVEEILRIYGYDNIVSQLPTETLSLPEANEEKLLERKIKNILSLRHGLSEVYNYSFVGEEQLKKLNIDFFNYLKLANPLTDIQTMLRQTLVPGLVANVKTNQAKANTLSFFEFGSVFFNAPGSLKKEAAGDGVLPYQEKHLGLVIAADDGDLLLNLKGIINNMLKNLINYDLELEFLVPSELPTWADKNAVASIKLFNEDLGVVAMLSKEAINNVNLKKKIAIAELNYNIIFNLVSGLETKSFKELSKYPTVVRDLAFVLNEKILYNEVKSEMINFNSLIKEVELFDIYSGNKLAADEKSLAFHISLISEEKTLTTEEVDEVINNLIKHLGEKFEAKLRD
ncbi:MAG: phenylalanine--tRNA ligase subunit beta [Patescibacteria group bacterium]